LWNWPIPDLLKVNQLPLFSYSIEKKLNPLWRKITASRTFHICYLIFNSKLPGSLESKTKG
jgi:hypothetical protein